MPIEHGFDVAQLALLGPCAGLATSRRRSTVTPAPRPQRTTLVLRHAQSPRRQRQRAQADDAACRTGTRARCVLIGLRGGRLITRDITPRGVGASLHGPAEASREETLQEDCKATRERIDGPSSGGFARVHTHGEGITRIPHTPALPDPDQARACQTPSSCALAHRPEKG